MPGSGEPGLWRLESVGLETVAFRGSLGRIAAESLLGIRLVVDTDVDGVALEGDEFFDD